MENLIVPLSKPYTAGEKTFSSVSLREPTFQEIYMDGLGKPQDWQPTPNGPMMVTYPAVINEYLQRLVVEPGYESITRLSAVDSLKLGTAICGFFLD